MGIKKKGEKMKKIPSFKLSIVGLGIALNVIGTFTAFSLKLPILLDSIGTIMVSFLLGPYYGIITGLCGSIVSGITFDIYSLYFAPVQIFVGFFSSLVYNKGLMKDNKRFLGVFVISIFSSFIGAIIAAFVFGGITSSSSSYIVAILSNMGISKVLSVFIVQFLIDYLDRFVAVSLVILVILKIPNNIKQELINN